MQRIYFCTGTTFLTGDDLANALLDYAWALAEHRRHDLVRLPTRGLDGSEGSSTLLVGPESQMSLEAVHTPLAEVVDTDLVRNLHRRASQLRDPMPGAPFEVADDTRDEPYESEIRSEIRWDERA
ncbi:MAG: hypothetical protein QOC59_129 [Microbacteriaceae bacterium]|jgi:hypothetical protein|nr:hypothetical protein [Microbacteriaceae bacterium]